MRLTVTGPPKRGQKRGPKWAPFLTHFLTPFYPFLAKNTPNRHQSEAQNDHFWPKRGQKGVKKGSKMGQNTVKSNGTGWSKKGSKWAKMGYFGPFWANMGHMGPYGLYGLSIAHIRRPLGPYIACISPIWPIWAHMGHIGLIQAI